MQRITGLDDAQVTAWEERLEAQVVASLQAVMDKLAARIERAHAQTAAARRPVLVAADGADLTPPEQTGQLAIPAPQPDPAVIPPSILPPGQPFISPDDLATIPPLWQQQVTEQVLPLVAQVFMSSAGHVRSQILDAVPPIGVLSVPALGSQAAEEYLRRARNSYDQIGDHLWATARAQLSEGFEAGESVPQLADRLRASAGLSARSSVLVARTSVIEASNFGSISMARVSGLEMQKEWIATPDLRTRPTHLAADGQRVDLNEPFIVGGFSADFPADPSLPPSERYRCRCTQGYVMPDRPKELPSSTIDQRAIAPTAAEAAEGERFPKAPGEEPLSDAVPVFGDDARYVRPSLVRAGSPTELARVWRDEMRAITGRDIAVDAIPASVSPLTAREYAEATLQMLERYPEALLSRIAWDNLPNEGYAWVYQFSHTMTFNEYWAGDAMRRKYLAQLKSNVAKWDQGLIGWSVRGASTPQATVYHEFYHILDIETLGRSLDRRVLQHVERRAALEGITADDLVARDISAYAGSDLAELIAEAGTSVAINGRNASLLAREITEMVDAEYVARGYGIRTRGQSLEEMLGLAPGEELPPGIAFPKLPGARAPAQMTVAELRAEAKRLGVEVPPKARKADLVRAVEERRAVPGELPSLAEVPAIARVMSRAEAEKWASGSAIDIELQHGTTEAAARSIQRTGFDLERLGTKTDQGNFGAGFYFNPAGAPSYGEAGGYGATLFARARVEKVMLTSSRDYARARAVEDYVDILHSQGPAAARQYLDSNVVPVARADRFTVPAGTKNADLIGPISDERLARYLDLRQSGRSSGFVLREWAIDEGYGAVVVDFPGSAIPGFPVRDGATWFEVNILKPDDIAIIRPKAAVVPRLTAAQRRQALIDDRRKVTDALSDIDQMVANGASERALAARAQALRGLLGEGAAADELAPLLDAMAEGRGVRAAADALEDRAGLKLVGGRSGETVRYDPKIMDAGGAAITHGSPVTVSRAGFQVKVGRETITTTRASVLPASADEAAAFERKAVRAAARGRAAEIAQARGTAQLLADVDQLLARKAPTSAIRQALDPALLEPEQLYAGADRAVLDSLREALDTGDTANLRSALTRAGTKAKVKPIGRAGAKATFDPTTMEAVGDIDIPAGARVVVERRGATLPGLTDPLQRARVRLDAPAGWERRVTAARSGDAVRESVSVDRGLTPSQIHAETKAGLHEGLSRYGGEGYENINKGLRAGKGDTAAMALRHQEAVVEIDDLMLTHRLTADSVLYRNISRQSEILGDVTRGSPDLTGVEFTDYAYGSTSIAPRSAGGQIVRMRILAPKGTPGISSSLLDNDEILLGRGLRYRVAADRGMAEVGVREIDVEILPSSIPKPPPALRFDAKAAKTFTPKPVVRKAAIIEEPPGKITEITAPDGATMRFKGSWVRVEEPGQPGKFYGSALDEWQQMYAEVPDEPGSWLKVAPVKAYRYEGEPRLLRTKIDGDVERVAIVREGDYVVKQVGGEVQRLTPEQFDRLYAPAAPSTAVKGGVIPPAEERPPHLRLTEPSPTSSSTPIVPTPTPANPQSFWGKVRDDPHVAWSEARGRPGNLDQVDRVYTAPTAEDAKRFLRSMGDSRLQAMADAVEDGVDIRGLDIKRDRETLIDRIVTGIREPEAPISAVAPSGYAERVSRIERAVARVPTKPPRQLGGGTTSDVTLTEYGDDKIVKKVYGRRSPGTKAAVAKEVDAEILAPRVIEAFDVPTWATTRGPGNEVIGEFIEGDTFAEVIGTPYWGDAAGMARASAPFTESAAGRRLGLADYVMGHTDRNEGNWIILPGDRGIAAIDNGYAFVAQRGTEVPPGFFTEYLMRGDTDPLDPYALKAVITEIDRVDVAAIRGRLEALRPEFIAAGRKSWHDGMMRRLREVEKRLAT